MGGIKRKGEQKKVNQKVKKGNKVPAMKIDKKDKFGGKPQKFNKKNAKVQNKKKGKENQDGNEVKFGIGAGKNKPVKKPVRPIDVEESDDDEDDDEIEEDEDDDEQEMTQEKDDDGDDDDDNDNEEEEEDGDSDEEVDLAEVGDDDEDEIPKQPKKVKKQLGVSQSPKTHGNEGEGDNDAQSPSTRLFISRLSKSTTNESLTKFLESKQIKLVDVFLPQRSTGYAFVGVDSVETAHKAVALSGQTLDGSDINVCFAKPRVSFQAAQTTDSQETNILFVKGLSVSTTKESLQKHFSDASDVRLMTNPDGTCKGHAFIEYSSAESAKSKKEGMHGNDVDGSKIIVDFAAPRGSNRFSRGGFNRSRGGSDNRRSFGDRRGGSFGGGRGGRAGKSFGDRGGGSRFGHSQRGGFRGGNNQRGSFRGNSRGRGGHVKFDDD